MSRKNMADLRNDKLTPKPCQENLLERKWQSIMAVKPDDSSDYIFSPNIVTGLASALQDEAPNYSCLHGRML
ncbi:uncharacterized [Tachysurus ichikawai]